MERELFKTLWALSGHSFNVKKNVFVFAFSYAREEVSSREIFDATCRLRADQQHTMVLHVPVVV
jgi:hypothetical protein